MIWYVGKLLPLVFTSSALICLVIVFVGCTSTSSPNELYFLRYRRSGRIRSLKSIGADASLGAHSFTATWLAVAFSFAAFLTWLIEVFCCCI
ncbi:unnamed protein product [Penicillium salamii]|uniref:Uncharacterized protein n=1 Tax=Penicillium salamii TaxID=1612424 RepID=A0A9W4IEJ2_9EURO|nr:unnamed protein product [Penicillium salamii]CAG8137311.1 unnamed protein product [Penicillium salamii]CAG8137566.1 unnamed protein product [Penicillium salamii]CAG8172595.1 unnamed protein product [Penicillium salamii]CAG8268383.1 unnamed protein product [Penicillium salamii]